MKRADIEQNQAYAVHCRGDIRRLLVNEVGSRYVVGSFNGGASGAVALQNVLMPWPQWLEQQEANKARTRDIDRQRQEAMQDAWRRRVQGTTELLALRGITMVDFDEVTMTATLRLDDVLTLLRAAGRP